MPDLSGIPGLPADATELLTLGLLPGLLVAVPGVGLVTVGSVLAGLGPTGLALAALDVTNAILAALPGAPQITGIPSLEDFFTVTQTTGNSAYNWPLLGLGPLLGLSGSTTFTNTFAQVPSLTGSDLVAQILDGLVIPDIAGLDLLVAGLLQTISRRGPDAVGDRLDPNRTGELRSSLGRPVRLARNDADHCPWSGYRPV